MQHTLLNTSNSPTLTTVGRLCELLTELRAGGSSSPIVTGRVNVESVTSKDIPAGGKRVSCDRNKSSVPASQKITDNDMTCHH